MGAFEYTALDTAGREQNGVVEGDTVGTGDILVVID